MNLWIPLNYVRTRYISIDDKQWINVIIYIEYIIYTPRYRIFQLYILDKNIIFVWNKFGYFEVIINTAIHDAEHNAYCMLCAECRRIIHECELATTGIMKLSFNRRLFRWFIKTSIYTHVSSKLTQNWANCIWNKINSDDWFEDDSSCFIVAIKKSFNVSRIVE